MRIISVLENFAAEKELSSEHGLSLFIETCGAEKILFDTGQSGVFVENAVKLGVDLTQIDFLVISHGHYDHGGGLKRFFEINSGAEVYIRQGAFKSRYSQKPAGMKFIGLDPDLENNTRFVKCDDFQKISGEIFLFSGVNGVFPRPVGNSLLFDKDRETLDNFSDEQNLVITENKKTFLFAGCAHCGIVNIMEKMYSLFGKYPDYVFSGFHLMKSGQDEVEFLAEKLLTYKNTMYYTMHCTGLEQFEVMKKIMGGRIDYFSCGSVFSV